MGEICKSSQKKLVKSVKSEGLKIGKGEGKGNKKEKEGRGQEYSYPKKYTPQKSNLKAHKSRHLSHRNFNCDYCDSKFHNKGDLIRHMKAGLYKVPYNLRFFPTPMFFGIFIFLPEIFVPFPLSPLDILPNSLNIIWKMILLPFPFFSSYIVPHSHDIPFPFHNLIFFPTR